MIRPPMLSAPRGMVVVLVMLVLWSVLFVAWWRDRRVAYFPSDLLARMESCDSLNGRHYGSWDPNDSDLIASRLADFREPSLYRRPAGSLRSVRFAWFPAYDDRVTVRIDTLANGQQKLVAKYMTRPRERIIERTLTAAEARAFDNLLVQTRFFDAQPAGCMPYLDGQVWLLEGSDPAAGYIYRQQQSPRRGLEHDLGQFMMGLTKWDVGHFPEPGQEPPLIAMPMTSAQG